jgi:hypothetical protein
MNNAMVDMDALEVRRVYRLRARNLMFGVWTGKAFLGIREKFWRLRLDEEYANESAGMFCTVHAAEPLDVVVPPEIPLKWNNLALFSLLRDIELSHGIDQLAGAPGWANDPDEDD